MNRYYTAPDISGNNVAFVSEDDLWEMDADGKNPRRITSSVGTVTNAKYSPDGKIIAFRAMAGNEGSSADIYIYRKKDGVVNRMTYLTGKSTSRRMFTDMAGWSPEGDLIISTNALSPFSSVPYLYRMDLETGNLYPLNLGPATHIIYSGNDMIIGRNTYELPHWKGYRGGTRGKLWIGNVSSGFRKLLEIETNISSPVLFRNRIYFITDLDGTGQIYSVDPDGKDLKKHTAFSGFYPRHLNTDGKRIVFSMAGDMMIFDPGSGKTTKILPENDVPAVERTRFADPKKFLESAGMNPDGSAIALTIRGRVFCSGENNTPVIEIGSEIRKKYATFVSGDTIAYVMDDGLHESLRIKNAVNGDEKTVDREFGRIYSIAPSPDGKKIAVADDHFELSIVDITNLTVNVIDKSREGIIEDISWSHDSGMITYSYPMKTKTQGGYTSMHIRLYSLSEGKAYDMTGPGYRDFSPSFDPDGKYIYYLSNRSLDPVQDRISFNFSYPIVAKPYVIPLYLNAKIPYEKNPPIMAGGHSEVLDLRNAYMRSEPFPVDTADYRNLRAVKNGIFVLKMPVHGEFSSYYGTGSENGTLQFFDFSSAKMKDCKADIADFIISQDGKKILYRKKENALFYASVNAEKTGENEEEFDFQRIKVRIDSRAEFRQMFSEAWKLALNNYWNEKRAMEISEKVFNTYAPLVERASTRYELSDIIREMQGEFRTSHSYEMGGDLSDTETYPVGKLGIDVIPENGKLVVKKVYSGDFSNENEKSPVLVAFPEISEGDSIISINGKNVDGKTNLQRELLNHAGDRISMKIQHKNGNISEGYVKTIQDDTYLRYRSWVENNRKYVHEKSGNRIGYLHIPDMGMMGLNEFYRLYTSESSYDGLIVDVRFNGGGFVSQLILEKLSNRRLGYDIPRRGTPSPYPQDSVNGPIISITNEYAGSDGDIYSHVFKMLKIGPLIGTRTWGGVVGINPVNRLIDGTVVTQPEFALWFKDVGFSIENYGVDPDVTVEFPPDSYYRGEDPQLDAAISMIDEMAKKGSERVAFPGESNSS